MDVVLVYRFAKNAFQTGLGLVLF